MSFFILTLDGSNSSFPDLHFMLFKIAVLFDILQRIVHFFYCAQSKTLVLMVSNNSLTKNLEKVRKKLYSMQC